MRYLASVTLAALIAIAGCSSPTSFEQVYNPVSPASLTPGTAIPLPKGKPILTVQGQTGNPNQGQTTVMDLPTLEAIGQVEYSVTDPFEKTKRTFRGILLRDLLKILQVSPAATTLDWVALNDYKISIPIDFIQKYPVLLAFQQDGKYMKEDYRGPAMLVLPYDHFQFDTNQTDAYWIWQIKSLSIH